jgi:deoxyribonuclease-4
MPLDNSAPGQDDAGLPLIGAQISTAGGFTAVPERALAMGAEAVQVFSSNPRMWQTAPPDVEELRLFSAGLSGLRLPLFFHSIYLINLASPDEALRQRSAAALSHALVTGGLAGAAGVVTHIGSHRGEGFGHAFGLVTGTTLTALAAAAETLAALPGGETAERDLPPLLLETGAGSGNTIGDRLEDLAVLLAALPPSAGLCLDTAHLFAAGHALHQAKGLESLLSALRQLDLLRRVGLVHLNDSGTPFASRRDRHENPGAGLIGRAGLARVVRHAALASVPFVLEVPGPGKHGPTAVEISTVKAMRRPAGSP